MSQRIKLTNKQDEIASAIWYAWHPFASTSGIKDAMKVVRKYHGVDKIFAMGVLEGLEIMHGTG